MLLHACGSVWPTDFSIFSTPCFYVKRGVLVFYQDLKYFRKKKTFNDGWRTFLLDLFFPNFKFAWYHGLRDDSDMPGGFLVGFVGTRLSRLSLQSFVCLLIFPECLFRGALP